MKFILEQLIRALEIRIGAASILGFLDFIPAFGFLIAGGINTIINAPFLYDLGKRAKNFLDDKIRRTGGRQNLLNIIEGYRDSISLIEALGNKNDWSRKMQVVNA